MTNAAKKVRNLHTNSTLKVQFTTLHVVTISRPGARPTTRDVVGAPVVLEGGGRGGHDGLRLAGAVVEEESWTPEHLEAVVAHVVAAGRAAGHDGPGALGGLPVDSETKIVTVSYK